MSLSYLFTSSLHLAITLSSRIYIQQNFNTTAHYLHHHYISPLRLFCESTYNKTCNTTTHFSTSQENLSQHGFIADTWQMQLNYARFHKTCNTTTHYSTSQENSSQQGFIADTWQLQLNYMVDLKIVLFYRKFM
jgi:hypothetical protein